MLRFIHWAWNEKWTHGLSHFWRRQQTRQLGRIYSSFKRQGGGGGVHMSSSEPVWRERKHTRKSGRDWKQVKQHGEKIMKGTVYHWKKYVKWSTWETMTSQLTLFMPNVSLCNEHLPEITIKQWRPYTGFSAFGPTTDFYCRLYRHLLTKYACLSV